MTRSLHLPALQQSDHATNFSDNGGSLQQSSKLPQQPTLNLIYRLCRALAEERIAYCHWKSNNALERSASGDNDLDLLVSRADAERFSEILSKLGFKLAEAPPDKWMPGVLDYYGYDEEEDKFVHAHVHYQLIVGHDMTKNYRLPIERAYLESAVQGELFKVPAAEFEFIVFVIRMVLKHSTWDTVLIRNGNLAAPERRELAYLVTQANRSRVDEILRQYLPFVGVNLFDRCLQALQPDASLWTRIRVGQEVQNALKAYSRRGQPHDIWLKLWRRVTWGIQRRILKRVSKRRLATGGALIVVVGGDGAGKSTAIDGLRKWLSKDYEVLNVHLGKPTWSRTTTIVRGILSLGRLLGFYPFVTEASILYADESDPPVDFPGYPLLIREVCKARDRYLVYIKARRFATNGGLVLCDRFPLSQINLMDGPIIERLVKPAQANSFIKRLIKSEARYYESVVWPELLITLKLDPQLAVERKTDEDADYVRARSQLMWSSDWQQTPAYVVDASRSKEEVLSELKSLIWSEL